MRPGREAEFEERYGPDGDWVRLFRRGEGYGETVLLRDLAAPGRYVVTDTWRDGGATARSRSVTPRPTPHSTRSARSSRSTNARLGEFERV